MKIVIERDGQLLDIYFNGNGADVDNGLGLTLQLVKCSPVITMEKSLCFRYGWQLSLQFSHLASCKMSYSLIGKDEFSVCVLRCEGSDYEHLNQQNFTNKSEQSTHPYALLVRESFGSAAQMVRVIFRAKVPCREYYPLLCQQLWNYHQRSKVIVVQFGFGFQFQNFAAAGAALR
ncbi:hypothetical protein T12_15725 [Trichinella patagoniensis]|uniref:Uncharacterized protein n=1 Tax=Trichinella patagoniensis TaxID=990121 RepID=A0A0V0Z2S8_9BILA|nr:hypothetical protein T12_12648 [Trichinella patagoniensis]KRY06768.1 hypothetical protein T12_15725 [Trichinella patagoniensis]